MQLIGRLVTTLLLVASLGLSSVAYGIDSPPLSVGEVGVTFSITLYKWTSGTGWLEISSAGVTPVDLTNGDYLFTDLPDPVVGEMYLLNVANSEAPLEVIASYEYGSSVFGTEPPYSHYFSVARQSTGAAIPAGTVSVYEAGTSTLVPVFLDKDGVTAKSNPFTSDSQGNYDFYVANGRYKIVVVKVGIGTFTTDNVSIGTQLHSSTHQNGAVDELLLEDLGGYITSSKLADGSIVNADVSPSAAIAESKLALSYSTHSNINDPSTTQKEALAGTSGAPSASNRYVTGNDSRLTNSRDPTAHAASHTDGGSDEVGIDVSQISGESVGTDLAVDLEEETHAAEHEDGGSDEIAVDDLGGVLADPQKVDVSVAGTPIGSRPKINLISGTNATVSAVDNPGANRIDVTVGGPGTLGSIDVYEGISQVQNDAAKLTFASNGFDVSAPFSDEAYVDLDLSEIVAAGDLSGNQNAPVVDGLQSRPLLSTVPSSGQSISWNGSAWAPADVDATKIQARSVLSTAPSSGEALIWNGSAWAPGPVATQLAVEEGNSAVSTTVTSIDFGTGFDVTESPSGEANVALDMAEITVDADAIQSFPVLTTTPTTGQILKYNGSAWYPDADNAGATAAIEEEETQKVAVMSVIDFGPGFDVTESPSGEGNVSIDLNELLTGSPAADDAILWNGSTWVPGRGRVDLEWDNVLVHTSPTLDFKSPLVAAEALVGGGAEISLGADGVDDTHIDWGAGTDQVDASDLPETAAKVFISSAQRSALTSGVDTTLHFHLADRSLSNSVGTLDATKVGTGLTDAQVSNTLTISTAGSVDAAAINSGSLDDARLGDARTRWGTFTIAYPEASTQGNTYIATSVTLTRLAARVRGTGTCALTLYDDAVSTGAGVTATTAGASTTSFTAPNVAGGSWVSLNVSSCSSTVTELAVTYVYTVN